MRQLTVRGFGDELERILRRMARTEGISLNQAALRLLRRGAGLKDDRGTPVDVVGSSLDSLMGTWSDEEAKGIMESVADFGKIDESMWR